MKIAVEKSSDNGEIFTVNVPTLYFINYTMEGGKKTHRKPSFSLRKFFSPVFRFYDIILSYVCTFVETILRVIT